LALRSRELELYGLLGSDLPDWYGFLCNKNNILELIKNNITYLDLLGIWHSLAQWPYPWQLKQISVGLGPVFLYLCLG